MLSIDVFEVGYLQTNCYLLHESTEDRFAVIDPGDTSDVFEERISKIDKEKFDYILLTHGHFDHIGAVQSLAKKTNAKTVICKNENEFLQNKDLNLSSKFGRKTIRPFSADILVHEGSILKFGSETINVIETPGHTKGSVCYVIGQNIFSGDTLMYNDIGRVDLPTGNMSDMKKSIEKLSHLGVNYKVYPGHGTMSDMKSEIQNNIYFRKDQNELLF